MVGFRKVLSHDSVKQFSYVKIYFIRIRRREITLILILKCFLLFTAAPGSPHHTEEQFLSKVFLWVAVLFMFWLLIAWFCYEWMILRLKGHVLCIWNEWTWMKINILIIFYLEIQIFCKAIVNVIRRLNLKISQESKLKLTCDLFTYLQNNDLYIKKLYIKLTLKKVAV